jgi:hypothetical protein
MRLDKHPILMQGHKVIQAIEECGCSIECTRAVTMAGELMNEVEKLVDELIARRIANKHRGPWPEVDELPKTPTVDEIIQAADCELENENRHSESVGDIWHRMSKFIPESEQIAAAKILADYLASGWEEYLQNVVSYKERTD